MLNKMSFKFLGLFALSGAVATRSPAVAEKTDRTELEILGAKIIQKQYHVR